MAVNVRGRSYKIAAVVDLTPRREGVLFAHGAQFGGHALYIKDGRLKYVYNYLGIAAQEVVATVDAARPGPACCGVEFTKEGQDSARRPPEPSPSTSTAKKAGERTDQDPERQVQPLRARD